MGCTQEGRGRGSGEWGLLDSQAGHPQGLPREDTQAHTFPVARLTRVCDWLCTPVCS